MKQQNSPLRAVIVTGLALFAMFFGAGNMIFPPMLGLQSGVNLLSAIFGFIMTGVLLPALGIATTGSSENGIRGLTKPLGKVFGHIYTAIVFLSLGVFYAVPRVATVSYETSLKPFLDSQGIDGANSVVGLFVFTLCFFVLTWVLAVRPGNIIKHIGAWLTPALLCLLALLILVGFFTLDPVGSAPIEKYSANPFATGLLDGYNTMDAIAAMVFGGVVLNTLRRAGFTESKKLFHATVVSGLIAAVFLAIVYLGLALLGARTPSVGVENGAQALSAVSALLFGGMGQTVLGLTVFLACLTTSVGLAGASAQYFQELFPQVSHRVILLLHLLTSLLISNLGLTLILKVISPLVLLTYPVTIALVAVVLLQILSPLKMWWAYRLPVWTSSIFAAWSALHSMGLLGFLNGAWDAMPLSAVDMTWVLPSIIMLIVGLALDKCPRQAEKLAN